MRLSPCFHMLVDQACMDRAHDIESLKHSWSVITNLADFVPLSSVAEAQDPYAHFEVMDVAAHQGLPTCGNIVIKKPHQGKDNEVSEGWYLCLDGHGKGLL